MVRWYYQYGHLASAELFRQTHCRTTGVRQDIIVRARLDTALATTKGATNFTLNLSEPRFRNDSLVHAPAYRAVNTDGYNERACGPNDPPPPADDPLYELHHCTLKFDDTLCVWPSCVRGALARACVDCACDRPLARVCSLVSTAAGMAVLAAMSSRGLEYSGSA
eukprot:2796117-Prymnesium_polylepis.1